MFPDALVRIGRKDLTEIAYNIAWLHSKSRKIDTESSVKRLIRMLRNELTLKDLKFIIRTEMRREVGINFTFETGFHILIESKAVETNLAYLCDLMELVKRMDLIHKIQKYKSVFCSMSNEELHVKLKAELENYSQPHKQKTSINKLDCVLFIICTLSMLVNWYKCYY